MYPVCESCLVLLCPALMSLLNINLCLYPRLRVPVSPSCVHRDRRPDRNRKRHPFTPFCFRFFKSFYLFLSVCPATRKSPLVIPAIAHCKSAWEFSGIAASAESSGRVPSCSADRGRYPPPAVALPNPRIGADSCPLAAAIPFPVD